MYVFLCVCYRNMGCPCRVHGLWRVLMLPQAQLWHVGEYRINELLLLYSSLSSEIKYNVYFYYKLPTVFLPPMIQCTN